MPPRTANQADLSACHRCNLLRINALEVIAPFRHSGPAVASNGWARPLSEVRRSCCQVWQLLFLFLC